MSSLSVIIVTYNNQSTIKNCLDSVLREKIAKEIIVIDNNSEDDTLKILDQYRPKITVVKNNSNLGYSKANNIGFKKSSGEVLIFLNPDTKLIKSDTLQELLDLFEHHSDYGIIGPKLINKEGRVQKSARNLPTIWKAIKEYLLGIKNTFEFYVPEGNEIVQVESVVGACIIIKKETFERVGGFDEKYFLYFEDLQLCKDVKNLRLKIGYAPKIIIQHAHGISGIGKNTNTLSRESAKKYFGKWAFFWIEIIGRIGHKLKSS